MFFKSYINFINIAVVVLAVTASVLVMKLCEQKAENKTLSYNLSLDKKLHNNEINEILVRYDSVLLKNKKLAEELQSFKRHDLTKSATEAEYQASLKILKGNISLLQREKFSKNKQLQELNSILKVKQTDYETNRKEIESLNTKIKEIKVELNSDLSKSNKKRLKAINVNAIGSRQVSKKTIETLKLKNTEQIKVCFTLEENASVEKGRKDIFVQVINPKSNVVSKNTSIIELKNKTLFYSAKATIHYEKENLDVCVFVDTNKKNLIKGNYTVNIFAGTSLIGNTNLSLL